MKIYDITVPISEDLPIYEGDPSVRISAFAKISDGAAANVTEISLGVHTATHIDSPAHFIEGAKTVSEIDINRLIGNCRVIELPEGVKEITPSHIPPLDGIRRIIFKTENSKFWPPNRGDKFRKDYVSLSLAAAEKLVNDGILLVGIDYLSIEAANSAGHPVHKKLLENEVAIVEGLALREIAAGDYKLICLPLKYNGGCGDGAPVRAVLVQED
ncbi:MAG TPA: cyclase family protein [Pyrinomonadaceae bacterium]|nr:cyclase family protein [Pyrinomonadaceae bacterium]